MQDKPSNSRKQRIIEAVDTENGAMEQLSRNSQSGWDDCVDSTSEAETIAVEETAARVRLDRPKHPPHLFHS